MMAVPDEAIRAVVGSAGYSEAAPPTIWPISSSRAVIKTRLRWLAPPSTRSRLRARSHRPGTDVHEHRRRHPPRGSPRFWGNLRQCHRSETPVGPPLSVTFAAGAGTGRSADGGLRLRLPCTRATRPIPTGDARLSRCTSAEAGGWLVIGPAPTSLDRRQRRAAAASLPPAPNPSAPLIYFGTCCLGIDYSMPKPAPRGASAGHRVVNSLPGSSGLGGRFHPFARPAGVQARHT